jgi:hypothetical protein
VAGDIVAGAPIYVSVTGADPGASVTVVVHSTPQTILQGVVDATGSYSGTAYLPDLGAGEHYVIASSNVAGQPVQAVGGFIVNNQDQFTTIAQPSQVMGFLGKADPRLQRALRFGLPIYDVKSHAHSTAAVLVAGASVLALAGSSGIASRSLNSASEAKGKKQSKVSSATTKKLKALDKGDQSWGDVSKSWQHPITHHIDRLSSELPVLVGSYSVLAPRILLDGAWTRAVFGARALWAWVAGFVLGILALVFHSGAPFVPSLAVLVAIMVLATFDAAAGAIAWLVIALSSLFTGQIQGWADFRTLLGLGVLIATIPLVGHAIRPLRRYIADSASERWERAIDYTLMPLFLAFAISSMAKALDGLSGLTILTPTNIADLRWLIGGLILARLIGEDLAAHFYPQRSKKVQPPKLSSPKLYVSYGSLVFKFALYLIVMDPYFGFNWRTLLAAALLAIPGVLKINEAKLPNSTLLHRWLPRGFTSFVFMMVLGSFVAYEILGPDGTGGSIDYNFLYLLVPGLVFNILDEFGRDGTDWQNEWLRRFLGLGLWVLAAGMVTGAIVLFS